FRFEAAFPAASAAPRDAPLVGQAVEVVTPDPLVRSAATAQIEASGGTVRNGAPVVLVDHAARAPGQGLAPAPAGPRGVVLLKPSERDLIPRYRSAGFHGYLIKPLRRASLTERVLVASGALAERSPGLLPPPPPEHDRVVAGRFAGTRVLLVEDNPVGALLASTLLKREGCAVETAASGHEALDAMRRARYDLVFMDMRMPG